MLNRNFGNYRTERLLGEGGLGAVYLATDTTQGRKVAIKFFHANLANNPQFQQRFAQEAQVMASLDHANIVRILNYSVQPGQLYLVMDYIAGPNLAEYVRSQARDQRTAGPQEAMRLAQQMSDGLDYAHRQNIWHLDLKPSNVLLRPMGDARNRSFLPLISDFGAYRLASSIPGSAAGLLKGNLAYLSPEQLRGERADARADLYTLGIMLYELTTGRPPFQPRSLNEAIQMHTREPAVPPSQVRTGVPR